MYGHPELTVAGLSTAIARLSRSLRIIYCATDTLLVYYILFPYVNTLVLLCNNFWLKLYVAFYFVTPTIPAFYFLTGK